MGAQRDEVGQIRAIGNESLDKGAQAGENWDFKRRKEIGTRGNSMNKPREQHEWKRGDGDVSQGSLQVLRGGREVRTGEGRSLWPHWK